MGVTAGIVSAVSSAYGAYASAEAGKKQADAARKAAIGPPKTQAAIDPNATRQSNANSAMAGIPGTLLTGVGGVNPNSLNTGKTLLGG